MITKKLSALKKAELLINEKRPNDALLRFEVSKPETIARALSIPDLTADDAHENIIRIIKDKIVAKLPELNMGTIRVVRGNPIVSVEDNFDKLLFPYDNAGRSSTYTRYVDEDHILKTHVSALVPETFKRFHDEVGENVPDTVFVFPGLSYRRDVIDPRHLDVFHQVDIWTIRKNGERGATTRKDLLNLVDIIFDAVFSSSHTKVEPHVLEAIHPYTLNGIEVYAKSGDSELEVLEAGLAHPEVLRAAGFDPEIYSGLALGMGLDRLVMSLKEMPDIRYLRSVDPRIASQMLNLEKFKDVSDMPAISRDMSYCVPENYTDEDICEEIKDAFGTDALLIEHAEIVARTKFDDLPIIAREKLGATENQDNVLVRITLRHPDKTLTKDQANKMYDAAYPKINKGTKGYV